MRKFFGVFFMLAGIFVLFYFGIWLMFACGVADAVKIAQGKINAGVPAITLAAIRILGSSIVGGIGACLFLWGGMLMLPPVKKEEKPGAAE